MDEGADPMFVCSILDHIYQEVSRNYGEKLTPKITATMVKLGLCLLISPLEAKGCAREKCKETLINIIKNYDSDDGEENLWA
ncbi:MAG: hypothetical protein LLG04_18865 [Parachlamydia sp.]|nr:hypothetical protein [Parachlamydia sp.]